MIILRQKYYSRSDYLGLNEKERAALKIKRNNIARELKKAQKRNNNELRLKNSDVFDTFRGISEDNPEIDKKVKENLQHRNLWHSISMDSAKNRANIAKELILLKR